MAQGNPALPAGFGISPGAGQLITEPFNGTPGGMNLHLPQQSLDDSEARYIQDGLVDYPGLTRRRGPVRKVTGIASLTRKASGLVMTLNPQGIDKYGVLNGDAANGYLSVLTDDLTAVQADLAWPHPLPAAPPATPYRIVDIKPALGGGALIGVSSGYDASNPNQGLALWQGGNRANYSAGSITVARGSAAVTAPSGFSANVTPGMWLFANTDEGYTSTLVGLVRSVNSDTSITLDSVSPYAITAKAATFQALRGLAPKVVTGLITADVTSTTITGGKTKFLSQHLDTGTWQLYRAKDMAFVGKVASVASEFSLTLAANAAVSLAEEQYVALRADADWSISTTSNVNKVGFLNAPYAGRQWYANNGSSQDKTSRVWFSDTNDLEALDLSDFDGDWDDVVSSSTVNEAIRAIAPANNGLLVLKENETFIITGNSPTTFSPKKLEDDGTLSGMSVQQFGAGVIWAGREGIHYYDGVQTNNITADKLGDYWKNTMKTFDPTTYRMYSMVNRDHYFLHIEKVAPTIGLVKGTTSTTPTKLTVVVNLANDSGAITLLTNVGIRGAVTLPAAAGKHTWYIVNDGTKGYIADGEALFNEEGIDQITVDGGPLGPDFFFESKKFDAGDPTRLKKFKQLMLHYLVQGGSIKVDTVIGLNNLGQTLTGSFPSSVMTWDQLKIAVPNWDGVKAQFPTWDSLIQGVFEPKRVKFQKGSQHLSFRLWQSSSAISRLQIGPFHIGYKMKRPGRV